MNAVAVSAHYPERLLLTSASDASWGRRFSAWVMDWIVLGLAFLVITFPIAVAIGDTGGETTGALGGIVLTPVFFAYFAVLNGHGQTLGKRALGIKVVDAETGAPIGVGRGAIRELVRLGCLSLLWIPFLIDGLRPLWNEHQQSWHDAAARSIVVHS